MQSNTDELVVAAYGSGLVPKVAYKCFKGYHDMDELISTGYEALVMASKKYNPDNTYCASFETYAWEVIKNAMSKQIKKDHQLMVVSLDAADELPAKNSDDMLTPQFSQILSDFERITGRTPNANETKGAFYLFQHTVQNMEYNDIAEKEGVSKVEVAVQVFRFRNAINPKERKLKA